MATSPTRFNVQWLQNGVQVGSVDMSKPAVMIARRVSDYQGFSFHSFWSGSPVGLLDVRYSNADQNGDAISTPENYVAIPPLQLSIGQGASPDTSPSMVEVTFNRTGWVSLLWTPQVTGSNPGTLTVNFDGIRR